jgi:hypothetical protein
MNWKLKENYDWTRFMPGNFFGEIRRFIGTTPEILAEIGIGNNFGV